MISLDTALQRYAERLAPLPVQTCPLAAALGRVLAEAPAAQTDLPPFTQSAVDGYALHHADLVDATEASPVRLPLVGEVAAGAATVPALQRGTALRIFTGGALPAGADTVARQEIVERDDAEVRLRQPLPVHADTRLRGEELTGGTPLAAPGTRVTPGVIAALAMAGVGAVQVHRAPRLALLVTGDEVARAGEPLQPGQIFDANGPLLQAWCRQRLGQTPPLHVVADTLAATRAALEQALAEADLVITTGGVSVGDHDHVRAAAVALGVEEVFWRVAQKPGMPLYFGQRGAAAVIGLPGNPGAVMVGLQVHVERMLSWLEGAGATTPAWRAGVLSTAVRGDARRELLMRMRVTVDAAGVAQLQPLDRQASHMLSNLTEANALVRITAPDLAAGTRVSWIPLGAT
ncbi:molybdopterin molybdotransferase MoeA [Flagellatimonas centrodinii]|uniref:molybdopterin molybdotransferase MoeA n=1 Tax=Flagellatimonas centrodinii TaxID=2806210 RepID=UPI001FEFAD26|nr:molybdopterin molybdotransferase MoeA [Flagellatimonas centrodinii]ULQ47584.1 molybdopterin molybdotransferase MoeA [Flagellatimonas centrodinii]